MIKPGTDVGKLVKTYICTEFDGFNLKNEPKNTKTVPLIKWSIARVFTEAGPS